MIAELGCYPTSWFWSGLLEWRSNSRGSSLSLRDNESSVSFYPLTLKPSYPWFWLLILNPFPFLFFVDLSSVHLLSLLFTYFHIFPLFFFLFLPSFIFFTLLSFWTFWVRHSTNSLTSRAADEPDWPTSKGRGTRFDMVKTPEQKKTKLSNRDTEKFWPGALVGDRADKESLDKESCRDLVTKPLLEWNVAFRDQTTETFDTYELTHKNPSRWNLMEMLDTLLTRPRLLAILTDSSRSKCFEWSTSNGTPMKSDEIPASWHDQSGPSNRSRRAGHTQSRSSTRAVEQNGRKTRRLEIES